MALLESAYSCLKRRREPFPMGHAAQTRSPYVVTPLLVVLLAGCGGGTVEVSADEAPATSSTTATTPTTEAPPTESAAEVTPEPAPSETVAEAAPETARQIVERLAASGMPVDGIGEYDAETDPNDQLGRPGGYTSKAYWVDTTIDSADVLDTTQGSVELGGSVETFGDTAAAQARADYIAEVTAGSPALTEYDFVVGTSVLRLSKALTPDEAQAYVDALN